jgi:hypothetical protein
VDQLGKGKKSECILCGSESTFFIFCRSVEYYCCYNCGAVFMAQAFHPSAGREKERYDKHQNNPGDPGYREFVNPLVNTVISHYDPKSSGLDFGAGKGPVAAAMLSEKGYRIQLYDLYFHRDRSVLEKKYNFIICSEVMEHFRQPAREFNLMRSLLLPGGSLICMTRLYSPDVDFINWRYKDDETHLIFYQFRTLEWIVSNCGYSSFSTSGRIIHFRIS